MTTKPQIRDAAYWSKVDEAMEAAKRKQPNETWRAYRVRRDIETCAAKRATQSERPSGAHRVATAGDQGDS